MKTNGVVPALPSGAVTLLIDTVALSLSRLVRLIACANFAP